MGIKTDLQKINFWKKKTHVSSRDCDSLGETTVQIECYSGRTIYQKINYEIH
jgi:hypothetical protein